MKDIKNFNTQYFLNFIKENPNNIRISIDLLQYGFSFKYRQGDDIGFIGVIILYKNNGIGEFEYELYREEPKYILYKYIHDFITATRETKKRI